MKFELSCFHKGAPKNRYVIGAKLSEHKFLRILRGYAEGTTVHELARTTHVTERSIRDTYKALRADLQNAVRAHPERFGMAGVLLFDKRGEMTAGGTVFLKAVQSSSLYRRHKTCHTPRLRCAEKEKELVFELAVRILCSIDLRHLKSEPGQRMALNLLANAVRNLPPRKPLSELSKAVPGARVIIYGDNGVFESFKHSLLNNPIGT